MLTLLIFVLAQGAIWDPVPPTGQSMRRSVQGTREELRAMSNSLDRSPPPPPPARLWPSKPTRLPGSRRMPFALGYFSSTSQEPCWPPVPMRTIHQKHVRIAGQWISGKLPLRPDSEVLEEAGPLGSLMQHTITMASPNVLRYASTGFLPVRDLANLSTEQPLRTSLLTRSTCRVFLFFVCFCIFSQNFC